MEVFLEFKDKLDEEVVIEAKAGNNKAQEYLISKYENFVKATNKELRHARLNRVKRFFGFKPNTAREQAIIKQQQVLEAEKYFLIGADKEDIYQEGMIGLYKSIRDFNPEKSTSFKAFAEICVTRQIITAIKTATRQKHIPLNTYVSLNKPIYEEESERTLLDVLSGLKISDPEELMISKEQMHFIEDKISEVLSSLERQVLTSYLDGKSYQEIACDLERHSKSIDNALQRVKRKLEKCLKVK